MARHQLNLAGSRLFYSGADVCSISRHQTYRKKANNVAIKLSVDSSSCHLLSSVAKSAWRASLSSVARAYSRRSSARSIERLLAMTPIDIFMAMVLAASPRPAGARDKRAREADCGVCALVLMLPLSRGIFRQATRNSTGAFRDEA